MLGWGFCRAGLRESMPRGGQAFQRGDAGNLQFFLFWCCRHWHIRSLSRRQFSKVSAEVVFRFAAQLHFVRYDSEEGPRNGRQEWDQETSLLASSPLSHPVSCSFLEGGGHWGSSRNPGTKSSRGRMRVSAFKRNAGSRRCAFSPGGVRIYSTMWPRRG